jgi:putative NADH-flavin reductase
MNLLIFGASGRTGQQLVNQALTRGDRVTAFVRDPSKLPVRHDNLNVFQGDVIHYQLVEDAVKGKDVVFSALGASSPFKYDPTIIEGMGHIIRAMETHNVERLIYMSFVGVKESRHTAGFIIKYIAPRLLSTEIAGHEAREKIIKESKLNWTIVRPSTLTNGKHTGRFRGGEDVTSGGIAVTISRADVADFMLRQLTDKTYLRKTPSVMY